jgi:hypothetical protein
VEEIEMMDEQSSKILKSLRQYPKMNEFCIENSHFRLAQGRLAAGYAANNPALAVGCDNTTWLAWSEMSRDDGDCIKLVIYDGLTCSEEIVVSRERGIEFQPALAAGDHRQAWIVWSAFRDNTWRIILREFEGSAGGTEEMICQNEAGVFNPAILMTNAGVLYIAWEEVIDGITVLFVRSKQQGIWSRPQQVTRLDLHHFRPCLTERNDHSVWLAYDGFDTCFQVYVQQVAPVLSAAHQVVNNGFQNFQPSLSSAPDGSLWIAWASNYSEISNDPWHAPRWIYMRRFDGENFFDPLGPQPGKDLARIDFFQGWEFPAVVVDQSGRIWVAGQSSHALNIQYYMEDQWSDLITFSQRKWGSWKPRCQTAIGPDGQIRLAAMGLQGLEFYVIYPAKSSLYLAKTIPVKIESQRPRNSPVPRRHPAIHDANGRKYEAFFGDIHAHSVHSDGVGDADEFYFRNCYGYGDDFAALTDHDYLDHIELSNSTYKWLCNLANRFNRIENFATLCAYEWTAPAISVHAAADQRIGEGHKNIYYPGDDGFVYSYGHPGSDTGAKLLDVLKGKDVIAIPHHIGWSGCYWDYHDPELQPLVEICSTHGRYEYEGNQPISYRMDSVYPDNFIQDVLRKGIRLGFTGGTDTHGLLWHGTFPETGYGNAKPGTAVGWRENTFRTGLTVILAPELTREALFAALKNRRCYATSGAKIFVDFKVSGSLIGSEITVSQKPELTAKIIGTENLRTIEIIRDGQVMSELDISGQNIKDVCFVAEDSVITSQSTHYYYLRVMQEDGHMAWTSPIWVTYR